MALTLDFAFEGLKFVTKTPVLFLGWCLFYVALSIVAFGVIAVMSGPAFLQLIALSAASGGKTEDPQAVLALFAGMWPGITVAGLIAIAGSVMFRTAIYRAMLKPSDKSLAYLRFGGDEWRQIGLVLLLGLIFIGVYLALILGVVLVVGVSALIKNEALTGILAFVSICAIVVLLVWFALRMTVAAPLTFDKGKLDLFGSIKLTKGKSWTLLGGFIILTILLIILQIISTCIFYAITLMATGFNMDALRQAANPDFSSLESIIALLGPVFIVQMLVGVILQVLGEVAFAGAQVGAYRVLNPPLAPLFAPLTDALEDMADQDA